MLADHVPSWNPGGARGWGPTSASCHVAGWPGGLALLLGEMGRRGRPACIGLGLGVLVNLPRLLLRRLWRGLVEELRGACQLSGCGRHLANGKGQREQALALRQHGCACRWPDWPWCPRASSALGCWMPRTTPCSSRYRAWASVAARRTECCWRPTSSPAGVRGNLCSMGMACLWRAAARSARCLRCRRLSWMNKWSS